MVDKGFNSLVRYLIGVVICLAYLSGCGIGSQQQPPTVDNVSVSPVTSLSLGDAVFTLSGSSVYTSGLSVIDLSTGKESYPVKEIMGFHGFNSLLRISPNYRYLSGYFTTRDPKTLNPVYNTFIIDFTAKESKIISYDNVLSWSPDSSRFLTYSPTGKGFALVAVQNLAIIADWPENLDFRAEKNFSSSDGQFLWDTAHNVPVARLSERTSVSNDGASNKKDYGLEGIVSGKINKESFEPLFQPKEMEYVIDSIIDPTGRYVLYAIWEMANGSHQNDASPQQVTDSVLVLVNIQTKERIGLFRVSTIDAQNMIVDKKVPIIWSSDGRNILVPRENAGALWIRVKNFSPSSDTGKR